MAQDELARLRPEIEAVFEPCSMTYLDGHWDISCYAEVEDATMATARPCPGLRQVILPVLEQITEQLRCWWSHLRSERERRGLRRLQSFVTRYRPLPGETHLRKHVDGHHVHGSCVLQLHSESGFDGGGISVWDPGDEQHFYQLQTGDLCLTDHLVWHQSHEISAGERWVLVVFCGEEVGSPRPEVAPPLGLEMSTEEAVARTFHKELRGFLKHRRRMADAGNEDRTEALYDLVQRFRQPFAETAVAVLALGPAVENTVVDGVMPEVTSPCPSLSNSGNR